MELVKQPETEQEYWETIEALGGFSWSLNHDFAHGRIQDPGVPNVISDARKILETLVEELGAKFGILHPRDCPRPNLDGSYPNPPEGKRWYWPCYKQMKQRWLEAEYGKIICSGCPLSQGVESFSGRILCSVFHGTLYHLMAPHVCAMLDEQGWTRERLFSKIKEVGDEEGLERFLAKERELQPVVA